MITAKTDFYKVIEIMLLPNGNMGEQVPTNFENQSEAESKLHAILSEAAVSEVPYHAAHIICSDGRPISGQVYDRRYNGLSDNWYWDEEKAQWIKGATPVPEPEDEIDG